jgi:hypothetical protein
LGGWFVGGNNNCVAVAGIEKITRTWPTRKPSNKIITDAMTV